MAEAAPTWEQAVMEILDTPERRAYGNDICFEHPESMLSSIWPADGEQFIRTRVRTFLREHGGGVIAEQDMRTLLTLREDRDEYATLVAEGGRVRVLVFVSRQQAPCWAATKPTTNAAQNTFALDTFIIKPAALGQRKSGPSRSA